MKNLNSRAVIGLAAALTATVGCEKEAEDVLEERAEETNAIQQVEEIQDNPAAYIGKEVTVAGEVEVLYGPSMMRLDGISTLWGDDILVLTQTGAMPVGVDSGDKLKVSGKVQRMTVTEVEREYDFDIQPEVEVEMRDYPVLVAKNIELVAKD